MSSTSLRELAETLRAKRTAKFSYGWAWDSPSIPPDGLRGIGVVDFERRQTAAVGVAIAPRVVTQMAEVSARNPLRWGFFRLVRRKVKDLSPTEYRFEPGAAWFRHSRSNEWRRFEGVRDPTWLVSLLDMLENEVASGGSEIELPVNLEQAVELLPDDLARSVRKAAPGDRVRRAPLHVSLSPDGVPTRVAISPTRSGYTGEEMWSVVELTEFGVECGIADLWAEWYRLAWQ